MADYSNRDMTQGALFINNRKKQTNHPDFRGELTLSKALLKELVEKVKEGKEAKLSLAVWKKPQATLTTLDIVGKDTGPGRALSRASGRPSSPNSLPPNVKSSPPAVSAAP